MRITNTNSTTTPTAFQLAVESRGLHRRHSVSRPRRHLLPTNPVPNLRRTRPRRDGPVDPRLGVAFNDTFRCTNVLTNGIRHALFFEAELPSGRSFDGVDYLRNHPDGLVRELRIMMRPSAQVEEFAQHAHHLINQLREQT